MLHALFEACLAERRERLTFRRLCGSRGATMLSEKPGQPRTLDATQRKY